ncbi:MAG: ABC transporter ATP-binding protein, partial [Clostridia bacterium]|nr:ABC transporter ATP-binding protein [Clostridia bacterium]
MIKIENLTVKYGKKVVYNNFSLQADGNKVTSILGESGCGKTTLLNAVAGLLPYSG